MTSATPLSPLQYWVFDFTTTRISVWIFFLTAIEATAFTLFLQLETQACSSSTIMLSDSWVVGQFVFCSLGSKFSRNVDLKVCRFHYFVVFWDLYIFLYKTRFTELACWLCPNDSLILQQYANYFFLNHFEPTPDLIYTNFFQVRCSFSWLWCIHSICLSRCYLDFHRDFFSN